MKTISGKELKQEWKKFREAKKHIWLPEAPLIGGKESTAMFNIAGMQQLIPYLSGQAHPLGKRLFNIQKCIRTVDIDEVGDASHLTFFEMMGNWSLGDYFKQDAVQWSWEFLTEVLWFDTEKLAATVFEWDNEVSKDEETIWYRKQAGLDEKRICAMSADDNRRSPGPVGPCGPCTEIYYRVGKAKLPPKNSTPRTDEKNWLEIRNNVFMQYYRSRRVILTDAWHCLYDNTTGKIKDTHLLMQLKSRSDAWGKVIMVSNNPDVAWFEKVPFVMDIFTLSNNPSKTDPTYFEQLLKKYNLLPDEVIYFDHKQEHRDAAEKAGIKLTKLYSDFESVKDFIDDNKYKLVKLAEQNVDTWMGFERMCTVLQQQKSVYETDVFSSLLKIITEFVWLPYAWNARRYRIIVDHLRTAFFLVQDGVLPSNEGRGYVLRRLVRRMYYNILLLTQVDNKTLSTFLKSIVKEIVSLFDLSWNFDAVVSVLEKETIQFQKTITNGQKLLQDIMASSKKKTILGQDAFKLYDTFWFPVELTKEIALEKWFTVDVEWFEQEMQAQQQRSRAGSKDMFKQDVDWSKYIADVPATKFVWYETMKADQIKLLKDFEVGGQRILIFDQTPLYAESGGQVSDSGVVILDSGEQLQIKEVKKYEGVFLHFVE